MLEWEGRDLKAGYPDREGELLLQLREYKLIKTQILKYKLVKAQILRT